MTSATVDASDFKVTAAMLTQVHGSHVQSVDARLVQSVHMRAGAARVVPVQPNDAPPDVLRRDALAALIDIEQRLVEAGWDVGKALLVTTDFMLNQVLKALFSAGNRPGDRADVPIDASKKTSARSVVRPSSPRRRASTPCARLQVLRRSSIRSRNKPECGSRATPSAGASF